MIRCFQLSRFSLRRWSQLAAIPPDPILEPDAACKADQNPNKINLTVGAYKDDKGHPFVLESVRKADKMIIEEQMNKEYPPLSGIPEFCREAAILGFGKDSGVIKNSLNCTVQTMSGAGGVRLAAEFLEMNWDGNREVMIPDPTWPSHIDIIKGAGLGIKRYKYYDDHTKGLNFEGMMSEFEDMKEGSVVVIHPCGHNPTGVDPSIEQWKSISEVLTKKKCCLFFDMAYQGFVSGDPDLDASSIRMMADRVSPKDCPIILVQSFSKNMGLYGERTATLSIVCESQDEKQRVHSNLSFLLRRLHSFCPINGARIATRILSNPELRSLWMSELRGMAGRIHQMRTLAVKKFAERGSTRDWSHIEKQNGMFCYTGLSQKEVQMLREKHSVYMLETGRMSVSGLNSGNIDYFVNAVVDVTS